MKTLFLDEICDCISGRGNGDISQYEVRGVGTDSRQISEGDLFFAIRGENFDGHDYVGEVLAKGAAGAVVERDIGVEDARIIFVDDVITALGRLAGYYRDELACTVIAVTGSNGKTTTREMIHHILSKRYRSRRSRKSFNNHIGVPLTILSSETEDEFLIVEAGSNHPGEIDYLGHIIKPDIAVITQISETHLEGMGSIGRIAAEKASLVRHVRAGGAIVVNGDNQMLLRLISHPEATVFSFGESADNDMRLSSIKVRQQGIDFEVNGRFRFSLPVLGRHNAFNCLAAIVVARRCGFEMEEIAEDIKDFKLPDMRLAVRKINGITIINDAYNANPRSMLAGLGVLNEYPSSGRRIFCCGDMLELGEQAEGYHRQLGRHIGCSSIDMLIAVGNFAQKVAEEAISAGLPRKNVFVFSNAEQAGMRLKSLVAEGDVVLLKGSRGMKMEDMIKDGKKMTKD